MAEHKELQNPENFSEKDYQKFEYLLFSEDTPTKVLEEIVMTLAHLPTKRAQDLLERFSKTDQAAEIEWMEPALDEGKAWFLWPQNEHEDRDMIALKLYHKKNDHIVELTAQLDVCEFRIKNYEIELETLRQLQEEKLSKNEKDDIGYRIIALDDMLRMEKNRLQETKLEIAIQEKINDKIIGNIKTERYKKLSAEEIMGFHFDGEE